MRPILCGLPRAPPAQPVGRWIHRRRHLSICAPAAGDRPSAEIAPRLTTTWEISITTLTRIGLSILAVALVAATKLALRAVAVSIVVIMFWSPTFAGTILQFSNSDGLKGEAEFTWINATTLEVRLKNTSTSVPAAFGDGADQLLTSISWQFDGTTTISGGSVKSGPSSASLNFSVTVVPDMVISGEYGFGNAGATGLLTNFVSSNTANATPFGGANLDGPPVLDGPQAGLAANPLPIGLGGQGAIQNEWIATLTLTGDPLGNLGFLANGAVIEFGSDAAFIKVPEPSSVALTALAILGLAAFGWRRRKGEANSHQSVTRQAPRLHATGLGATTEILATPLPSACRCPAILHEQN